MVKLIQFEYNLGVFWLPFFNHYCFWKWLWRKLKSGNAEYLRLIVSFHLFYYVWFRIEFVTEQTGPGKTRPPSPFPHPPHSMAWGGVSFSEFPAPVTTQAPAPPIPQTGPASAKINPVSEAQAPRSDASDVVCPSSASPASGRHSQRRLRPDVISDLTHIPLLPHISCSSPPPYLTSWRLFSCLASPQHRDASPRYPLFLLLPGVLITTCRRYHPSNSCQCASYYYYYHA